MNVANSPLLQSVQRLDLSLFDWCQQRRYQALCVAVARRVSRTADGWLYPLLPLVLLPFNSALALALFAKLAVAFPLERLLYTVLKKGFKRRRPPDFLQGFRSVVVAADEFSFPSGHTSAAFLVCFLVTHTVGPYGLLLLPWAVMVGMSRVFLGVHFPTDIVAGALLGCLVAASSLFLLA